MVYVIVQNENVLMRIYSNISGVFGFEIVSLLLRPYTCEWNIMRYRISVIIQSSMIVLFYCLRSKYSFMSKEPLKFQEQLYFNWDLPVCAATHLPRDTPLTHLPLGKMAAISHTIFSNAFSWMKSFIFCLKFHWSLFLRAQLTIFHQWFR